MQLVIYNNLYNICRCERGCTQGVLDDVQALRQGPLGAAEPPRVQVLPARARLRSAHGGGRPARPRVRGDTQ